MDPSYREKLTSSILYHAQHVSFHSHVELSLDEKIAVAWYTSDIRTMGGTVEGNWWYWVNGHLRKRDVKTLANHLSGEYPFGNKRIGMTPPATKDDVASNREFA